MKSSSSSSDEVDASFEADYSDAICHSVAIGVAIGRVRGVLYPPLSLCPLVNSVVLVGRCCVVGKYQISERP